MRSRTLLGMALLAASCALSCNLVTGIDDYEKVDALVGGGGGGTGLASLTTEVFAGRFGTCVIDVSRRALCWGLYPGVEGMSFSLTPQVVELPGPVITLGVGAYHRCAQVGEVSATGEKLKTDFYCWGDNGQGQLGDGSGELGLRPRLVQGLSGILFDRFSLGHSHTCAAQLGGGRLFCWGANQYGQLGDGTTTDAFAPVELLANDIPTGDGGGGVGGAGGGSGVATWNGIQSAGSYHTCATLKRNDLNETYCWGRNDFGQLGQPASALPEPVPQRVDDSVSVSDGFDRFDRVFGGGSHTCARGGGDSKPIYCWGRNDSGQLGDGTTISRHAVKRVEIPKVDTLLTGIDHTCALFPAPSGAVTTSCWGKNDMGQANLSVSDRQLTPADILFGEVTTISASRSLHSCAFKAADQSLWCWGANDTAQLGLGTFSPFEREPQLIYTP